MTTPQTLLTQLRARGAILAGHFKLSSGRHSAQFVQKFRILEDPPLVADVAASIIGAMHALEPAVAPTVVVSAAVGGIVLGYECARQLGTLAIFIEKENGVPTLRRGFVLGPADRALIVEDVVTTGRSVREVSDVVRATGASVAAIAVIVARAPIDFGVPAIVLLDFPIESVEPDACPQCAAGIVLGEPGSRFLTGSPG